VTEALIGLVGILVGSFIAVFKDLWTSYRERRIEGSYSAIRLIGILEAYADQCIEVVQDDGMAFGLPAGRTKDGEEYLRATVATPEPPEYPDDIGWRSLEEAVMHQIVSLPNKTRQINRDIKMSADFAFPPDYDRFFDARQEGYARLALGALEIVSELRKQFQVSRSSGMHMSMEWDPQKFLKEKIAKFDVERHERRAEIDRSNGT